MNAYQPLHLGPTTLLEQVVQHCLTRKSTTIATKRLQVNVDLSSVFAIACDREWLSSIVQQLIDLAIDRSPSSSHLSMTACQSNGHIEFEIADEGSGEDSLPGITSAWYEPKNHPFQRYQVSEQDIVRCTRCPQGGVAWTLRLPAKSARSAA